MPRAEGTALHDDYYTGRAVDEGRTQLGARDGASVPRHGFGPPHDGRHDMPVFGAAARAKKGGANLAPDRAVGRRTWEQFLAERVGSEQPERVVAA